MVDADHPGPGAGRRASTGNGYRSFLHDTLASEGHAEDFVGTQRNGSMADPDNEGHSGWRIDQITRDAPDATVLVATVIVSTSGTEEANRPAFNNALPGIVSAEQAAGKHVRLVDMSALTSADLSDSLHPDDDGYRKMADAFNAGIQAADTAGWIKAPVGVISGLIRSGIAGKCLDVNGADSANGTRVQIWSCNNGTAQFWTAPSDGTLRALGKCLDVTGAGTANGTGAEIWNCSGGGNQQWQPYNGGYRNPASGRCLDDPAGSTTDGTRLAIWDCNGGTNQKWAGS
ncbi:ricin-type beta-trefoil lectin domain protein [Kitasatospora cineracea]